MITGVSLNVKEMDFGPRCLTAVHASATVLLSDTELKLFCCTNVVLCAFPNLKMSFNKTDFEKSWLLAE
jgi:hypothetical protein